MSNGSFPSVQVHGFLGSVFAEGVLRRLAEMPPADVRVWIVADRGFAAKKLDRVPTEELRFD
jgi:hypothetical protein